MKISKCVVVAGLALSSAAFAQNNVDRAMARELVADAGARTSLLQGGGATFSQGRFTISDGTGINTLNIGGTIQFRYNLNFRDDATAFPPVTPPAVNRNDFTHGFNVPLGRIKFHGNIGIEGLGYMLSGRVDESDGDFRVEDAFVNYDYGNGFSVRAGQFILGYAREQMVAEEMLLANWFSNNSAYFAQGRSQGIQASFAADTFRIHAGFSDGFNSAGTNFNAVNEADYAVNLRAEAQLLGATNWARWDDFTSFRSAADFALLLGAAVHFQGAGSSGAVLGSTLPDQNVINYTVDVSVEDAGWNAFAAFYGRTINAEGPGGDFDDFGVVLQGGVFVADQWEIYARGEGIFPDGAGAQDFYAAAVGVNFYITPESHAAKLNFQVNYAFDATAGAGAPPSRGPGFSAFDGTSGAFGWLGDSDDGELSVAVTAQIMF